MDKTDGAWSGFSEISKFSGFSVLTLVLLTSTSLGCISRAISETLASISDPEALLKLSAVRACSSAGDVI